MNTTTTTAKKTKRKAPAPTTAYAVTGVCDDGDTVLQHLLDELDAGLAVLAGRHNPGEELSDEAYEMLHSLARKAKAARKQHPTSEANIELAAKVLATAKEHAADLLTEIVDLSGPRSSALRLARQLQCDVDEVIGYVTEGA